MYEPKEIAFGIEARDHLEIVKQQLYTGLMIYISTVVADRWRGAFNVLLC